VIQTVREMHELVATRLVPRIRLHQVCKALQQVCLVQQVLFWHVCTVCVQCETYSSKGYTKDCGQCGISQESSCGLCVED